MSRLTRNWWAFILLLLFVIVSPGFCGVQIGGPLPTNYSGLIEAVQLALERKGADPGPIDGIWGPTTEKAFVEFSRARNLPVELRLTLEHIQALWDIEFNPESATVDEQVQFLQTIGVIR